MLGEVLPCHAIGSQAIFRAMEGAGACVMDVHAELYMYMLVQRHALYAELWMVGLYRLSKGTHDRGVDLSKGHLTGHDI